MVKKKLVKQLINFSAILAQIAIGLALAGGALPIVILGFVMPQIIMQIAGWTIVISTIISLFK